MNVIFRDNSIIGSAHVGTEILKDFPESLLQIADVKPLLWMCLSLNFMFRRLGGRKNG
jgi:hypothetical protein